MLVVEDVKRDNNSIFKGKLYIVRDIEEIRAKYKEACTKALKNSRLEIQSYIDGNAELGDKYHDRQSKFQHYAIALGWVLGISKDDTRYRCDTQFD